MDSKIILNPGYTSSDLKFSNADQHFLYDINDIEYIDMSLGAGSLILGHCNNLVQSRTIAQLQLGSIYLQNNPCAEEFSHRVKQMIPESLTRQIYSNSGSEATQRALRIARAFTGKTMIASFEGGWHGMNEWTLTDDGGRFGDSQKHNTSFGIPSQIYDDCLTLPYNSEATFSLLDTNKNELAAVIIEPIQGSNPQPHIQPFLRKLREFCSSNGILLIFDEIISGFRLSKGGAAELLQIYPDIATYGKVLGGGLPSGLTAISEQIYQRTFSEPDQQPLTGGTYSANPLTAAAGLATLIQLDDTFYSELNRIGSNFRSLLNQKLKAHNLPFHINGIGSISRLYFTDERINSRKHRDEHQIPQNKQDKFIAEMFKRRVLWPRNGILCHPSTFVDESAHTVVNKIIDAAKVTLAHED